MRFHCGPSLAERAIAREKRLQVWHPWFAWRPVRIDGTCVWLERIERRLTVEASWDECWYERHYRWPGDRHE